MEIQFVCLENSVFIEGDRKSYEKLILVAHAAFIGLYGLRSVAAYLDDVIKKRH